jgi:K+-transporting ATPase ATPase A chain
MWTLPILIIGLAVVLSIPGGYFLAWIMDGRYRPPRWLAWIEARLNTGPQSWKQYVVALLLFNTVMFAVGFVWLLLQPYAPKLLNPDGKAALGPTTLFNSVCSFMTNTDLQHYSGEQVFAYSSQLMLIWNMFLSASVGLCALAALTRGLRGDKHMGNYYLDMWRVVVYAFLPLSLVFGVLFIASGVPMTLQGSEKVTTLEPASMGTTDDGQPQPQVIARGPVAALMPIKHLGTNGGGFFGANSCHPFENPSSWTNLIETVHILFFPFSLVVMFGVMLKNLRHAAVIYAVMMIMLVGTMVWGVYWDTIQPNPGLTAHPALVNRADPDKKPYEIEVRDADGKVTKQPVEVTAVAGLPVDQELGNLEGKELRFGTSAGSAFSVVTTAAACGSVNCMHDSLNPLALLSPFSCMWLNCVFGGKGVGVINMMVYLVVGVFLAGLMVGRTPEYLGKKVEAREMKLAMLALLIHPIMILAPAGLFAATIWGTKSTNNPGAHGFSEILYEFSSSSQNNGSETGGLQQTWGLNDPKDNNSPPAPYSPYWDIATGLVMLISRYIPIVAPIALAGCLAVKKPTPFTSGTLRTDTITFGFVLLGTVLLVGALLFLPAAVIGPVSEHLGPIPFGG